MPRIVAISDTHGFYHDINIPDGDILVHAGDITGQGTFECLEDFNEWLGAQPHKHKIVIAGNHDWCFEWDNALCRSILSNGLYLQDESVIIEGIKFYGSPWQPVFFDWAFNLNRGKDLAEKWAMIPGDTEILVTHGPAYGILDEVSDETRLLNVGCQDLFDAILRVKPKVHIFGHIHEGYGETTQDDVHFVNASINTSRYRPTNPPIIIDY
jgi:Icc-related predicted phosphoesterase